MPSVEPFVITPAAALLQQHPFITGMKNKLDDAYQTRIVEEAELQTMGKALWDALQLGNSLTEAKLAVGEQVLPIIIESGDAAILTLPWETLYHPDYGFLGREAGFSLSRHDPSVSAVLPELQCEPLRVLLFTSLPDDLGEWERLDLEAEQAAVQEALMGQEREGEIVLEMPDDGRLDTLCDALQRFKPHLVYLSGHGHFTHEPHQQQAYGSFLFEDTWGRKQEVPEAELATYFQDAQVQLLVMSACWSAKQHPKYPHNGLSAALYRAGIPHVIGMRESVFDQAGIQFAKALLHSLGQRSTVDMALQQARAAIIEPFNAVGGFRDVGSNPVRAAQSYGQWCLPQLLSHDRQQGLVDWKFTPQAPARAELNSLLGKVSVPEQFRGRRRELRQWQNRLRDKTSNSLLITGAGGMGKTALAHKLLQGLHKDGYRLFTFSLRPEHNWQAVLLEMQRELANDENAHKEYEHRRNDGLAVRAGTLLKLLLAQCGGKLALLFDNLESVQDGQFPHAVTDTTLQHWLQAAHQLTANGLKLILTSRWQLPDWADTEHHSLGKPVYGDYVAMVRLHGLDLQGERLQTAYKTLGGNFRALVFFAEAIQGVSAQQVDNFEAALQRAAGETQTDMALAQVMGQHSAEETALLHRLLAYQTAVPSSGIDKIWDAGAAEPLLERLLAVSLVEQYTNPHTGQTEYQLAPLVRSWLLANGAPEPEQTLLQKAAEFLLWQLEEEQNTSWEHILATHAALLAAKLTEAAQQLVLDWIVGSLNRAGMYRSLLDEWLLSLVEAENPQIRSGALGQIGKQYLHIGDYDAAFDFLKKSLTIAQKIGNKSSEGAALDNIAQIHSVRGDYGIALDLFKQSLAITQEIGDKEGEGATLNNMGEISWIRGDYDAAIDLFKQSLAIHQEIGDKKGEGLSLNAIGVITLARSDYSTALDFLKKSLTIQQEVSDKYGEGTTLSNISRIFSARGDYDAALDLLKQSLAIQQELGSKHGEDATINNISQIYSARGDYDTALDLLNKSLAFQQEIGNKFREGMTLNSISQIYSARGDYDTALDLLKQSLAIQQELGDKKGEGTTLNSISQIHDAHGDYNTALDFLKQSLAITQEIGDKKGEGTTLNNISQIYSARGDYGTALDFLKRSLAITQDLGNKKGEGATLNNMATIAYTRGDYDAAFNFLKKSLAIAQEIGDKEGEGAALGNISQIYSARGDYDTALDLLKQSLAIQQELGDKKGEGTTLNSISQIHDAHGDYNTALDFLKQSLAITQEIGDKKGEGTTLNNISQIYSARGDYGTALDLSKQSLAIQQEIGDKSGEGTTLNNMASIAYACGDYDTALDFFKQSLAILQEIGDKSREGATINNISQIYEARGDYDTAFDFLKKSLAIQQEIGDKSGEGTTLNNMASIAYACGDYDTSLDFFKQSLAILQEIGDKSREGATINNISQIYEARGDHDTALDLSKQSLAIQQEIGDKKGDGATLNNMATIAHACGDYDTALDFLKKSLAIRQEIGDKSGEGVTLNNISQIYSARGDYDTTLDFLKQSLAITQEIGDVAGLCATLFNMGHIHVQNGETVEATQAWVTAYGIAKKTGHAQTLQALEKLAEQLELPGGLQFWEMLMLAQRMGKLGNATGSD